MKYEEVEGIFSLSKSVGWQVIKDWIETRVKNCDEKLENINEELGYEQNFLIYVQNISERSAYKRLLKKIEEWLREYGKGRNYAEKK